MENQLETKMENSMETGIAGFIGVIYWGDACRMYIQLGLYTGYVGIMGKKVETAIMGSYRV